MKIMKGLNTHTHTHTHILIHTLTLAQINSNIAKFTRKLHINDSIGKLKEVSA